MNGRPGGMLVPHHQPAVPRGSLRAALMYNHVWRPWPREVNSCPASLLSCVRQSVCWAACWTCGGESRSPWHLHFCQMRVQALLSFAGAFLQITCIVTKVAATLGLLSARQHQILPFILLLGVHLTPPTLLQANMHAVCREQQHCNHVLLLWQAKSSCRCMQRQSWVTWSCPV